MVEDDQKKYLQWYHSQANLIWPDNPFKQERNV
jgi:hypothetical protein